MWRGWCGEGHVERDGVKRDGMERDGMERTVCQGTVFETHRILKLQLHPPDPSDPHSTPGLAKHILHLA